MPCPLRLLWVTEEKESLCQLRSMLPVNSCAEVEQALPAASGAASAPLPLSGCASPSVSVSEYSFSGKLSRAKRVSGSRQSPGISGSRFAGSGLKFPSAPVEGMPALSRRTDQGDSVCVS